MRFNQRILPLNQSLHNVSIYQLLKALESRVADYRYRQINWQIFIRILFTGSLKQPHINLLAIYKPFHEIASTVHQIGVF
jgi:hypothetical protein